MNGSSVTLGATSISKYLCMTLMLLLTHLQLVVAQAPPPTLHLSHPFPVGIYMVVSSIHMSPCASFIKLDELVIDPFTIIL